MRINTALFNQHRKGPIPTGVDAYHAGRGGMEVCMMGYRKTDGIYHVRATAKDPTGTVYCDMTTDGGGWMLIARTDPRTAGGSVPWGWMANGTGSLTDFSQAFSLGWVNWHNAGARFTEFIYGNRKNINNNEWGPFIYKRSNLPGGYDNFYGTNYIGYLTNTTLKANLSVYNYSGGPGMQSLQGAMQDVPNMSFFMRDVAANDPLGYGVHSDGMSTTYVNNTDPGIAGGNAWQLSGPWAINTRNASTGEFDQTDGSGNTNYGGNNQVMIMVRNSASGGM